MRTPNLLQLLIMGVTAVGAHEVSAAVTTQKPTIQVFQINNVGLTPTSVIGGGQATGVVTLVQAGSGTATVTLRSSSPQIAAVPPSVIIQPGATSATFIVQTYPIAVNPNTATPAPSVQISAAIGPFPPKVVSLTVNPATLSALALNPANVAGGTNATGTVTISGPAPSGGITIALSSAGSSSAPSIRGTTPIQRVPVGINMPSQVVVAAGATSATFPINTRPVSASTTYQINASWGTFVTKTATLTVSPPDLASISVSKDEVFGGNSITATVRLTAPAPSEGVTINLRTWLATGGTTGTFAQCGQFPSVPSTVTIAGGTASADFTVTTYPGYGVYWVEASSTTTTQSSKDDLDVDAPHFEPVLPSIVKGGTVAQGTIQLSGPAMPPNCTNRYSVVSSNTNFAQVPAYVDVTPGSTQAALPVTTSALPANAAPVTITISVTGTAAGHGAAAPRHETYSANLTITP